MKINKIILGLAVGLITYTISAQGIKFGWDSPKDHRLITNYNIYINKTNIINVNTNWWIVPFDQFFIGQTNEVFVTSKYQDLESTNSNILKFVLDSDYKIRYPKPQTPKNLRKN